MKIDRFDNYTLINSEQNTVNQTLISFKNNYSNFIGEHLILNFSEENNVKIEELLLFLELSNQHQKNGTSFVLVCNGLNFDEIPDELNVVPTLTEALDILEMDAIERDLGF